MNLLRIDFEEIYRRHLCRHGEFGINVLHLIAVVGVYLALFGLVTTLLPFQSEWAKSMVLVAMLLIYLVILATNIPAKVFGLTFLFISALLAVHSVLPVLPFWCYPLIMFGFHQFQQLHHRWYALHRDMSEFSDRYRKGLHLFLMLSVYELPILLRYLVLGQKDWVFSENQRVG